MKKMITNLFAMLAVAMVSLTALAAAFDSVNVKVNIPFEFSVSNKVMPAGEYQMTEGGPHNLLVIRNYDKRQAAGAMALRLETNKVITQSRLEFRRYGSQYFLAKVFVKGSNEVVTFYPSTKEGKAAEEWRNLAGATAQPEIVTVNAMAAE